MKTIRIAISEETYSRLEVKAQESGRSSVASYLLETAGELTDEAAADELTREALEKAKAYEIGKIFRVKELFPKEFWKSQSTGVRLLAGKQFFAFVTSNDIGIKERGKASDNHQLYERMR